MKGAGAAKDAGRGQVAGFQWGASGQQPSQQNYQQQQQTGAGQWGSGGAGGAGGSGVLRGGPVAVGPRVAGQVPGGNAAANWAEVSRAAAQVGGRVIPAHAGRGVAGALAAKGGFSGASGALKGAGRGGNLAPGLAVTPGTAQAQARAQALAQLRATAAAGKGGALTTGGLRGLAQKIAIARASAAGRGAGLSVGGTVLRTTSSGGYSSLIKPTAVSALRQAQQRQQQAGGASSSGVPHVPKAIPPTRMGMGAKLFAATQNNYKRKQPDTASGWDVGGGGKESGKGGSKGGKKHDDAKGSGKKHDDAKGSGKKHDDAKGSGKGGKEGKDGKERRSRERRRGGGGRGGGGGGGGARSRSRDRRSRGRRGRGRDRRDERPERPRRREQSESRRSKRRDEGGSGGDSESKAITALRRIFKRVDGATPETLPELQQELLTALAEYGSKLGDRKDELLAEANMLLQSSHNRAQENAEAETARFQEFEVEANLLKEKMTEWIPLVDIVVERRDTMKEAVQKFMEDLATDLSEEAFKAGVKEIEDQKKEINDAISNAREFAAKAGIKEGEDYAREQIATELKKQNKRIAGVRKSADGLVEDARNAKEKVAKRLAAQFAEREEDALFKKYAVSGKGAWYKDSVFRFGKEEFKFELTKEARDRVFERALPAGEELIPRSGFVKVKSLVGIERQTVKQQKLREQRLEKERKQAEEKEARKIALEAKKFELQTQLERVFAQEGDENPALSEKNMTQIDTLLKRLGTINNFKGMQELDQHIAEIVALVEPAEAVISGARQRFNDLPTKVDNELLKFWQQETKTIKMTLEGWEARLKTSRSALSSARTTFKTRRALEAEKLRPGIVSRLREHMKTQKLDVSELFMNLRIRRVGGNKDTGVSEEEFTSFLRDSLGHEGAPEELGKFFRHLCGDKDTLELETLQICMKCFYKVVEATVIHPQLQLKGAAVIRKVYPGEIIEFLLGPQEDPEIKIMRIKGRAVKDGVEGWISLANSKGKPFMDEGGNTYRVKAEGPLTEAPPADVEETLAEAKPVGVVDPKAEPKPVGAVTVGKDESVVRPLRKGEMVDAIEWERGGSKPLEQSKVRVRAKFDGTIGWTHMKMLDAA